MSNNNIPTVPTASESIFDTETPAGPIDKEEFRNAYNPLIQQVDSFIGTFSTKSKEQAISYGKRLIQAVLTKSAGDIHLCEYESTRSIGPHGVVAKNCIDGHWYCSGDHTRRAKERFEKKQEEENKRRMEAETKNENEKLRKLNEDLAKKILIWEKINSTEEEKPLKKKQKTASFEDGTKEKPTVLDEEISKLEKEPENEAENEADDEPEEAENAFEEVSNASSRKQKRKYGKRKKAAESGEPKATEPSN